MASNPKIRHHDGGGRRRRVLLRRPGRLPTSIPAMVFRHHGGETSLVAHHSLAPGEEILLEWRASNMVQPMVVDELVLCHDDQRWHWRVRGHWTASMPDFEREPADFVAQLSREQRLEDRRRKLLAAVNVRLDDEGTEWYRTMRDAWFAFVKPLRTTWMMNAPGGYDDLAREAHFQRSPRANRLLSAFDSLIRQADLLDELLRDGQPSPSRHRDSRVVPVRVWLARFDEFRRQCDRFWLSRGGSSRYSDGNILCRSLRYAKACSAGR